MDKEKFYRTTWFVWIMLFVFPPVGIFLLWKYQKHNMAGRIVITAVFGIIFLSVVFGNKNAAIPINAPANSAVPQTQVAIATEKPKETAIPVQPTIQPTTQPVNTAPIKLITGNYTVGKDILKGTYNVVAVKGTGNFFVNEGINENEILSADGGDFGTKQVNNVELKDGDKIKITNGLVVNFIPSNQ